MVHLPIAFIYLFFNILSRCDVTDVNLDVDEDDLDWVETFENWPEFGEDVISSQYVHWGIADDVNSDYSIDIDDLDALMVSTIGDEEQNVHFDYNTFVDELENKNSASLQKYKYYADNRQFSIANYTKFKGVSVDSLEHFIESTWMLYARYTSVGNDNNAKEERLHFYGNAVLINVSHLLTCRHNVYDCIMKSEKQNMFGTFTYYPCTPRDYNSDKRYELVGVYYSHNTRQCGEDVLFSDASMIITPAVDSGEFNEWSLGPRINSLFTNDVALIKLTNAVTNMNVKEKQAFSTFELIDETTLTNGNIRLVMTGFGLPKMTKQQLNGYVQLYNKENSRVLKKQIYEYFGYSRKTFAISDVFEYPVSTSKYVTHRLHHHIPNWSTYSGSPIAWVDSHGILHPFAIQSDGFHDWNVAVVATHPFIKKILQQNHVDL